MAEEGGMAPSSDGGGPSEAEAEGEFGDEYEFGEPEDDQGDAQADDEGDGQADDEGDGQADDEGDGQEDGGAGPTRPATAATQRSSRPVPRKPHAKAPDHNPNKLQT